MTRWTTPTTSPKSRSVIFPRLPVPRSVLPTSLLVNSSGSTLVTSGLKTPARKTLRPPARDLMSSEMTVTSGSSGT